MKELIQFEDGKYGIKRTHFDTVEYLDLVSDIGHWWALNSQYIDDCKANSIIELIVRLQQRKFKITHMEVEE